MRDLTIAIYEHLCRATPGKRRASCKPLHDHIYLRFIGPGERDQLAPGSWVIFIETDTSYEIKINAKAQLQIISYVENLDCPTWPPNHMEETIIDLNQPNALERLTRLINKCN